MGKQETLPHLEANTLRSLLQLLMEFLEMKSTRHKVTMSSVLKDKRNLSLGSTWGCSTAGSLWISRTILKRWRICCWQPELLLPPDSQHKLTNAADMQNQGIEIGVDALVISNKDLTWNTRVSWWKNKGEVTRLDIPSFTTGGFADFIGMFRIKEGHSPTEIIGVGPNPDEDGYVVYGNSEPDFQMNFFNSVTWKGFELSMLWHWKKGGDNVNLTTLVV